MNNAEGDFALNPLAQSAIKVGLSALVIVAASETARRSTWLGAVIVSLPLTSLLAFVWLWLDTHDATRVALLASNIAWLIVPSFALFLLLPVFLRAGWNFWAALGAAVAATALGYVVLSAVLRRAGIQI